MRQPGHSSQAGQSVVPQVQAGQLVAPGESLAGDGRDLVVAEVQPGQAGTVRQQVGREGAQSVAGERETVELGQT